MAKNKNKKGHPRGGEIAQDPSRAKKPKIVKQWDDYFQEGELEDWQRLMRDLGIEGEFASKSKCRKVYTYIFTAAHFYVKHLYTLTKTGLVY